MEDAWQAADQLAKQGIDAEVIDLRTLRPLDDATIMESVAQDAARGRSSTKAGAPAASRPRSRRASSSKRFWSLDAPIARVCTAEVPIPYPKHLEDAALPQPPTIVAAARAAVGR